MLLFCLCFYPLILCHCSRNSWSFLLFTLHAWIFISQNFFFCLHRASFIVPVPHSFAQTTFHLGLALCFAPGKACNLETRQRRKSRKRTRIKKERERTTSRKSGYAHPHGGGAEKEEKRKEKRTEWTSTIFFLCHFVTHPHSLLFIPLFSSCSFTLLILFFSSSSPYACPTGSQPEVNRNRNRKRKLYQSAPTPAIYWPSSSIEFRWASPWPKLRIKRIKTKLSLFTLRILSRACKSNGQGVMDTQRIYAMDSRKIRHGSLINHFLHCWYNLKSC